MMDWKGLRKRQNDLKVSHRELANRTGYSYSTVKNAFSGAGTEACWRRLAAALGLDVPPPPPREKKNAGAQEKKEEAPAFVPGGKYAVRRVAVSTGVAEADGKEQRLRYLRKEGKHHVFQCLAASWLTTFTDQQLIGMTWKKL